MIYQQKDTDSAYEIFLETFKTLYDKHCPIKEYNRNFKYTNCPWITKGLQNACKKKNTLHRDFIRQRTKEAENKYKKYKNKLTHIIRKSKKEYFGKILEDNKNNKGIWNILNSIIRNGTRLTMLPRYFIDEDNKLDNMEDLANKFNNFFVNVGPHLAASIPNPGATGEKPEQLLEGNSSSMFLTPVDEKEILAIFKECKNKKSTDVNDIDMTLVKKCN